jgi:anthranilate phosphoribosyltransferase
VKRLNPQAINETSSDTTMDMHAALVRVLHERATLSQDEAQSLLAGLLRDEGSDHSLQTARVRTAQEVDGEAGRRALQLAALLGALGARGESAAEIAGFAAALRAASTPLPLTAEESETLVDTCGTGGDGSDTFNISTAAALVAAAAGARVAKHGNRAVTSRCGSGDVLEALGIPIFLAPAAAAEALRTHGFAFLHAPSLHPALAAVMPVRRALGVRTTFNILGPLANPAGARAQVMGVYAAHLVPLVAEAMVLLGVRHAFVVHGTELADGGERTRGLDEISLSGPTQVATVSNGRVQVTVLTPEELGMTRAPLSALAGGDSRENAAILRAIFAGEHGPSRDVVVLNAAAVLVAAELAPTLNAGILLAQQTIDSGRVTRLVAALSTS